MFHFYKTITGIKQSIINDNADYPYPKAENLNSICDCGNKVLVFQKTVYRILISFYSEKLKAKRRLKNIKSDDCVK